MISEKLEFVQCDVNWMKLFLRCYNEVYLIIICIPYCCHRFGNSSGLTIHSLQSKTYNWCCGSKNWQLQQMHATNRVTIGQVFPVHSLALFDTIGFDSGLNNCPCASYLSDFNPIEILSVSLHRLFTPMTFRHNFLSFEFDVVKWELETSIDRLLSSVICQLPPWGKHSGQKRGCNVHSFIYSERNKV